MAEYTKPRSKFYLKLSDNNVNYTDIMASDIVKDLLQSVSPQLIECSPTGWKQLKEDRFNLRIPNNCMDWESLDYVKSWAEYANQYIWLSTNKNTKSYFQGNEVDYCLAADWNLNLEINKRTDIGEAEYQLKYNFPKHLIEEDKVRQFAIILSSAVRGCINCFPFDLDNFIITTIPAVVKKQKKLAWQLANHIACELKLPFVKVTLTKDKPQMKEQTVHDKVCIWRKIYNDNTMLNFSDDVNGKNILIIDDLYQSGASIWCFAEYLKNKCGVKTVIAIASVKAMKDGGNK